MRSPNRQARDATVAEAVVDCYNDSECVTGVYTMLDEHLDLPLPTPPPRGTESVEAYAIG